MRNKIDWFGVSMFLLVVIFVVSLAQCGAMH